MSDITNQQNEEQDFEVIISSKTDDDTVVITSSDEISQKWLLVAINSYDSSNQKYSAYLSDGKTPSDKITPEYLDELSENAQNDINKIKVINSIIRKQINKNDIVGKTVESIETNINTEIKLSYNAEISGRNKSKQLTNVKDFINSFNEEIKFKKLVRNAITTPYCEGTYISYLRHKGNGGYVVDYYPLGVCEISDYDINGEPVVLFNVQELRSRLQKMYKKNRKNVPLFFKNIEEEVKANYPDEVYNAFIDKEQYAKLDTKYTGVIRIGNMNRKYGLSPIFRSLESLSMLETFDNADRVNSKAKAKKIIHQKLRKEVLGTDLNKKGFEEMAYAHNNFMSAWKQPTVVVTSPATVESITYVEPKIEMTNKDTVNNYRSRVLSTLGIGFLMESGSQSVSTANISVTQLMRTINKISEQLEDILKKWYKQILKDNNLPIEYCPNVQVIDSEQLEFELKKDLAELLFCKFNSSYETAFNILGLSIEDEKQKRIKENDENLHEVFFARETAYTSSGGDEKVGNLGGRPKGDETDKQVYDKNRQNTLQ
jgi:hypothetical protein